MKIGRKFFNDDYDYRRSKIFQLQLQLQRNRVINYSGVNYIYNFPKLVLTAIRSSLFIKPGQNKSKVCGLCLRKYKVIFSCRSAKKITAKVQQTCGFAVAERSAKFRCLALPMMQRLIDGRQKNRPVGIATGTASHI